MSVFDEFFIMTHPVEPQPELVVTVFPPIETNDSYKFNAYIPMNTVVIEGLMMTIVRSSEVIEADAKVGKKYWQGHVVRSPMGQYATCTSSWQDTKTGTSKVTWSAPYYAEAKNIGKANETTNESQAHAEFESMVMKEKRVRESDKPLPMLAKVFSARKSKIVYPVAVQPKLDGMRMLTDGLTNWTRKNKQIDENDSRILEHILTPDVAYILGGAILDGEFALPWFPKVSVTMTAVKKFNPELTPQTKYFVYDIVSPDVPFKDRTKTLSQIVEILDNPNIVLVETHICENEEEVMKWHAEFTKRGFEGSIIRDLNAEYAVNRRVDAVLKHKDFVDAEFLIVDIIPAGGGSSAEVGKFICQADNGELFESTATGTEEERRDFLKNKSRYIGKYAKVKYRELSGLNSVPFHSNVLEIRETKNEGY